jgi:hypothetical protein
MPPQPNKPPGDSHVSLGEKPGKEKKRSSGSSLHRVGTQTKEQHAAAEKGASDVKRLANKAPLSPPKKGGTDARVL